jgi:hypothetical protein
MVLKTGMVFETPWSSRHNHHQLKKIQSKETSLEPFTLPLVNSSLPSPLPLRHSHHFSLLSQYNVQSDKNETIWAGGNELIVVAKAMKKSLQGW